MSIKSIQQECLTRVFQSIERESVLPECATRVSSKSVRPRVSHKSVNIKVSHKSVSQEYATRVSRKSVPHDCPRRAFKQEWFLMRSSISWGVLIVL